ncbi:MAG: hydroxyethylthiazole kinase [Synergistaceae bacterium]|nr:hydroxyethylthiazole kinase [Synergistaceae bacterium]
MLGKYLENVRKKSPLIHNITNYVTVNDVANILLAVGASPIMSDEPDDAVEITQICNGLNINIGTLNSRTIKGMFVSAEKSFELKHVNLLDPVGAGASKLRTDTAIKLMQKIKFDVIRGNSSEIKTLVLGAGTTHGVDADKADTVSDENLDFMVKFVKDFASSSGSIIALTGAIDLVADSQRCYVIRNGRPEMGKITGTGCQLSGLITAFIAAEKASPCAGRGTACGGGVNLLDATASGVCAMGLAGEIAFKNLKPDEGNSTYRNRIIDAIYNMTGKILDDGAKYEIR